MSERRRLLCGLAAAVLLHCAALIGALAAGCFDSPPPAVLEEAVQVSITDAPEEIEPEEAAVLPPEPTAEEAPELTAPKEEPRQPVKQEAERARPEKPKEAQKKKPPLPYGARRNAFEDEAAEKAAIPPKLYKQEKAVILPGTPEPPLPFLVIDMIIGADGKVEKAAVAQSCGSPAVDAAMKDSVLRFVFIPGKNKDNKPIRCVRSITLTL